MNKETETRLFDNIEKSIDEVSRASDEVRNLLRKKEDLIELLKQHNLYAGFEAFTTVDKILEYRLLIGIIFLDLASSVRAHLNAKFTYEKLFSLRQIIVIINEGYKQIYSFVNKNESGDLVTRNRNKSFWFKDIGNIVNNFLPELIDEYKNITTQLEVYFDKNFSPMKGQRDLFVHYDKSASKVYDAMTQLNVDKTFSKLSPFLGILTKMFRFTAVMASIAFTKEKQKKEKSEAKIEAMFDNMVKKLEQNKTKENEKGVNELIEMIRNSKRDLMKRIKSPDI